MLDLKVHHYVKMPNSTESRLTKVDPYVRICRAHEPPIFLQGGAAYSEGGPPVTPLPEWFEEELAKITPKALEECGWGPKVAPVAAPPEAPRPQKPVTLWTCGECGADVPMTKKGFHVAKHRREAKAEGG